MISQYVPLSILELPSSCCTRMGNHGFRFTSKVCKRTAGITGWFSLWVLVPDQILRLSSKITFDFPHTLPCFGNSTPRIPLSSPSKNVDCRFLINLKLWKSFENYLHHNFSNSGKGFNLPNLPTVRDTYDDLILFIFWNLPLLGGWNFHCISSHPNPFASFAVDLVAFVCCN